MFRTNLDDIDAIRNLAAIRDIATHIFPRTAPLTVERVTEGLSTRVYRIHRAGETFYLRVLPEVGASFAPEAYAHTLLRARGVKVPEVIYVERYNAALERSVMVTTAIVGQHIGHCRDMAAARQALVAAGRDLAIINSVPVDGFGWIARDSGDTTRLEAEFASYRAFAFNQLEENLTLLGASALRPAGIVAVRRTIERYDALFDAEDAGQARLAHGDFDATHIYQQEGRYTGVIDFGEIRGADPCYDLGHVKLHDGEKLSIPMRPYLLEGYACVAPLPADALQRITLTSLIIAIKALSRQIQKGRGNIARHNSYVDLLVAGVEDAAIKALRNQ